MVLCLFSLASGQARGDLGLASTIITSQPQNQAVKLGGTATFTVGTSTPGLVCIWFCNGAAIVGQNSTTLTVNNVKPENVGFYVAQVYGNTGQVLQESSPAILIIPSSDLVITANPESQKVFLGTAATFFVGATGPEPLGYQWFHNDQAIAGATAPQLTLPGILEKDAGSYLVRVTSPTGGLLSKPADLIYSLLPPPTIVMPPLAQSVAPGQTARFEVQATGSGTLSYAWRHNGSKIEGATNSVLVLNSVQPADEGDYWVEVTNANGTLASAKARLNVLWLAIAPLIDVSVDQGSNSQPVAITLLGGAQSVANATLSVSSSNPSLLTGDDIFFSGSGSQRFMLIFAKPNSSGVADLTITASAGDQSAVADCTVTVIGPNLPPTISGLAASATVAVGQSVSLPFVVSDQETAAASLLVQATLLGVGPLTSAQVTGQGSSRVLVLSGSPGATGTQSVAVSARDGAGLISQQQVTVSVIGPRLQLAREGTDLLISCLEAPDGGSIEFRSHLTTDSGWQPLALTPDAVGGIRTVRIPAPAGTVFFRWKN